MSEAHLKRYLEELHNRQGYKDYKANKDCPPGHGKGAGKGPSGTFHAGEVAANMGVPDLLTEVNLMNAEVSHLHMFIVLLSKFGLYMDFKTLIVHNHYQQAICEEFNREMAKMTEKLRESVLEEFPEKDRIKIKESPLTSIARKYYLKLSQVASEHVRR